MEDRNESYLVKLAVARLEKIANHADKTPYDNLVSIGKTYRNSSAGKAISEVPGVHKARDLFKNIGIDPTKRRPSSEALLRRGLKDKGYSSINLLVDIGNWCSLEFLLPVCVYDALSIDGTIDGRIGIQGEGYIAIDNNYLDLNDRFLICDQQGAIGSPIKDSLRTRVTENTTEAVILLYAPGYLPDTELLSYLNTFIERVLAFCGGILIEKYLLSRKIKD
jgi:DNA/RNA-binding domain of Phe-tRNA-synthetase-like protein